VNVMEFSKLKDKEWAHYIRLSYDLIRSKLPKKIQNAL
jgi:predicted DNA-binding protein (MmcQ/YjbR family)